MKTLEKVLAGATLAFVASLLFMNNLNAQIVKGFFTEKEDTFVLKLIDNEVGTKPTKIILIYDSNLIALETQGSNQFPNSLLGSTVITCISSVGGGTGNFLKEDFEESICVEGWMLDTFNLEKTSSEPFSTDSEEAIDLEDWMYKPNTWLN